ncbi:MAG TPA: ROK family protein [Phycisphaerales bacterium]|nr:ROK family protein [Phycisphaerales bacterium]
MSQGRYLGIDLGGTNVQIGVVDSSGAVLSRSKRKTIAEEGRDAVLGRIADGVDEACRSAGVPLDEIRSVGMGAPGPVDPNSGVVLEAVNLKWEEEPIAEILGGILGKRVYLDNDVNVAIYGEWRAGAGRGADHLMGAWIGTGVGGGLILNGALYYGHYLTAGEVGHMILHQDNPPGSRSVEHNCSRTAICNRVRQLIESGRDSVVPELVDGKLGKIKSRVIAEAYGRGDELVVEIVDDAARRLGTMLGGIVTLLSLERIVLGGGLTEAIGKPWVRLVRDSIHSVVFPEVCRDVRVVASELEDNAGVVGAAFLAMERGGG